MDFVLENSMHMLCREFVIGSVPHRPQQIHTYKEFIYTLTLSWRSCRCARTRKVRNRKVLKTSILGCIATIIIVIIIMSGISKVIDITKTPKWAWLCYKDQIIMVQY